MSISEGIIIKPVISEKSLKEAGMGRYTFLVRFSADKKNIRQAVEELFDVNVKKVFTNVVNRNKTVLGRFGRKTKKLSYKKARVVIGKDQKIDIFEEAIKEK